MKSFAKFSVAMLCIMAAMALFITLGGALILGQWAAIFGAVKASEIKTGLMWIGAGLLLASVLQVAAIKLLASEPEWNWWWIVGATVPVIAVASYFGLTGLAVVIAPFMFFYTRWQVKRARAKASAIDAEQNPVVIRQLWS